MLNISHLLKAAMGADRPWRENQKYRVRHSSDGSVSVHDMPSWEYCKELAQLAFGMNESWPVVNASHPWHSHMSFDYRQYYRSMPPDKEIFALRNEHLWEDWVNVNHLLCDDEYESCREWPEVPPFQEIHRNVSTGYKNMNRWTIQNQQEQMWLCQLLHNEIRTYLMIVTRAVNLNEDDLLEAATAVDEMCGGQYILTTTGIGANSSSNATKIAQ